MKDKQIKICLTENAQVIYSRLGHDPNEYSTAYEGESAGLDLYNMGKALLLPGRNKWVAFGEKQEIIPTGVRVKIPPGYVGLLKERGSIIKCGLKIRAGVIDPGYTDEIFVSLVNVGEKDTKVETGAKLPVQLIVVPCISNFQTVSYTEFLEENRDAKRKAGKVGSSD